MITVFTPTYNRAYIIGKLFASLKAQTVRNFEWLVINDGGSDDTTELMKRFMSEDNGFPIIYREVENGGKHRAINKAVQMAGGEGFFTVDSDDWLLPDAMEKAEKWFKTIADKDDHAAVSGLKGYSESDPIGGFGTFEGEFVDATYLERDMYNLMLDKAEIYKTEILKKYPFPEFEGEKFITEATVWNSIGKDGYKIRWFNEVISIGEYLEDGLTKNANSRIFDSPLGYSYYLDILESILGTDEVDVHRLRFYQALITEKGQTEAFRIINMINTEKDKWN